MMADALGLCNEEMRPTDCSAVYDSVRSWLQIAEHLQSVGAALVYLQILCSLVGSLGEFYSGVPVADLAISLFALVAIESGNYQLFRIYFVLLGLSLLLDVFYFLLVGREIRSPSRRIPALRLFLVSQATSSTLRLLSTLLWLRVYQLNAAADDPTSYQPLPEDLEPAWADQDLEALGGSIYDPVFFSTLFAKPPEPPELLLSYSFDSSASNPG